MIGKAHKARRTELPKAPTGIDGFDEITGGGLPRGRPTLVVGGPGSGKTLFAMEFLVNGALNYGEPGAFISFEETETELAQNVASLGFDLDDLVSKKMLAMDNVKVESSDIIETGEYDLEGLFVRLGYAIDSIGAKRVALDTIEAIFSSFSDTIVLRSELRRLFRFLKDRGVTAVVTGEKGNSGLTHHGLEEYVSDVVITLDNRVMGNVATRRMRIVKYRGSSHGSNEYPFLIDEDGFSVLPITSLGLTAEASEERITSGVPDLDAMLQGEGYYKGSTVLVTGDAGTGKTSFGAAFARAACEQGKRALFITFEESPSQVTRNMRSIGIDLRRYVKDGLLMIRADRPTSFGLEMHLVTIHKTVDQFKPEVVVLDPISSLMSIGEGVEVRSTMIRLVDYLKTRGVTSLFTDLKHPSDPRHGTMISSLVDTWILLENTESNGETNRILRLVKSRGMPHSNQLREFRMTGRGIELIPPYIGPGGVLTGSARYAQEARERAEETVRAEEIGRSRANLEHQRRALDAQIEALKAEFEERRADLERTISAETRRLEALEEARKGIEARRSLGGKKGGEGDG